MMGQYSHKNKRHYISFGVPNLQDIHIYITYTQYIDKKNIYIHIYTYVCMHICIYIVVGRKVKAGAAIFTQKSFTFTWRLYAHIYMDIYMYMYVPMGLIHIYVYICARAHVLRAHSLSKLPTACARSRSRLCIYAIAIN